MALVPQILLMSSRILPVHSGRQALLRLAHLLMSRESSNLLVSSEEIPGDNKAGATLSQYLLTHIFTLSFFFNILEAGQVPLNNDVGSVDDEGDMSR